MSAELLEFINGLHCGFVAAPVPAAVLADYDLVNVTTPLFFPAVGRRTVTTETGSRVITQRPAPVTLYVQRHGDRLVVGDFGLTLRVLVSALAFPGRGAEGDDAVSLAEDAIAVHSDALERLAAERGVRMVNGTFSMEGDIATADELLVAMARFCAHAQEAVIEAITTAAA